MTQKCKAEIKYCIIKRNFTINLNARLYKRLQEYYYLSTI